ncbi:MAG: hypothetical protein ACFCUX_08660 [Candidatus Methylacidiphilales bacterium]
MIPSAVTTLKARLYLEAVLPCLTALVKHDPASSLLIKQDPFSVEISCGGGYHGVALLDASSSDRSNLPNIHLHLPTAAQCVNLFTQSGFALPIPLKGWTHFGRMRDFKTLSTRLQNLLQPDKAAMQDAEVVALHVHLSLRLAVSALVPMLEYDPEGITTRASLPKAVAEFLYRPDRYGALWLDLRGPRPVMGSGEPPERARVTLEFCNDPTAILAMSNQLDGLAALGRGDLKLSGFVPMADGLDLVMSRIQAYISPSA